MTNKKNNANSKLDSLGPTTLPPRTYPPDPSAHPPTPPTPPIPPNMGTPRSRGRLANAISGRPQPENVFVGEDDCLKIGDFGLSRTEAAIAAGVAAEDDDGEDCPDAVAAAAAAREDASPTSANKHPAEEAAIVPRLFPPPPLLRDAGLEEGHTTGVGLSN